MSLKLIRKDSNW